MYKAISFNSLALVERCLRSPVIHSSTFFIIFLTFTFLFTTQNDCDFLRQLPVALSQVSDL